MLLLSDPYLPDLRRRRMLRATDWIGARRTLKLRAGLHQYNAPAIAIDSGFVA